MKILNLNVKNIEIPVVFESSNSLEVANLKLVFKVAGACKNKKSGLARLAANMLNEGTKTMGSVAFARELESRAISLDVSAGFETFGIDISCLKEHFSFALSSLEKLLRDPNLTDECLAKCKTITLGEISNNQNDNDYLARCGLYKMLYNGTNLAEPTIGTSKSLQDISLKDISEFLSLHMDLSNLFIVFGGDVKADELDELKSALSVLNVGSKRELEIYKTSDKCETSIITKQSEQAYIYFGSPFNVAKDERFKASVAMFVLGESGFGSRIMEEIRVKRGLAYAAYARGIYGLSSTQVFGYLQTKNESKDEAISVVRAEFEKFIKNGVSKSELLQAKKFLLGSLPLRLETLFKRLNIAQDEFYKGEKLGSFIQELKKIEQLTQDELNSFISSHSEIGKLSFCVLFDGK
ncbi:M16 family metallopeptidase [Campylobacter suis]|uniref:Zinc protease n=1 Tax=Campylobacter suis TaxID=2790657 RepID=A0ABM8Q398_9BACT|nr:pitrilysin family protein [Campylobacter suis]CAD7287216.1 putative zinc protease [Campylobacter suis]